MALCTDLKLFKAGNKPIDMDKLYMAFQPLKPLSDNCYEQDASWSKVMILLLYDKNIINKAEFLISNTWGELFLDTIDFVPKTNKEDHCIQIADFMLKYSGQSQRFFIYQFSATHDPKIVYQLKKAYNDLADMDRKTMRTKKKPYLDRL